MTTGWILSHLLLAGAFGLLGQSIRAVAGLSKLKAVGTLDTEFRWSILLLSLFIGSVAGALSFVAAGAFGAVTVTNETALAMMAAGYAGTDFIESTMLRRK